MKRNGVLFLLLCSICFLMAGCLDYDTPKDKVETMDAEVSPMTYIDSPVMSSYPIEGMWVKVGNADFEYMDFNEIAGFKYDRGYAYKLQIERTTLGNPPADGSGYTYKLVKELSKEEQTIGIELPAMEKDQLFPSVMTDGTLPRKTFSMGHACEKRYYIEGRKIQR